MLAGLFLGYGVAQSLMTGILLRMQKMQKCAEMCRKMQKQVSQCILNVFYGSEDLFFVNFATQITGTDFMTICNLEKFFDWSRR